MPEVLGYKQMITLGPLTTCILCQSQWWRSSLTGLLRQDNHRAFISNVVPTRVGGDRWLWHLVTFSSPLLTVITYSYTLYSDDRVQASASVLAQLVDTLRRFPGQFDCLIQIPTRELFGPSMKKASAPIVTLSDESRPRSAVRHGGRLPKSVFQSLQAWFWD